MRLKDRQQEYKARMTRFLDDPAGYREFIHKRRRRDRLEWSVTKPLSTQPKNANREPNLGLLGTSQFDLNLFREAQVQASMKDEQDQFLGTGKLQFIQLGKHEYRVWYQAPYHGTYPHLNNSTKLFICHLCLEVSSIKLNEQFYHAYLKNSHSAAQRHCDGIWASASYARHRASKSTRTHPTMTSIRLPFTK